MSNFVHRLVHASPEYLVGDVNDHQVITVTTDFIAYASDIERANEAFGEAFGPFVAPKTFTFGEQLPWHEFNHSSTQQAEEIGKLISRLSKDIGSVELHSVVAVVENKHLQSLRIKASEQGKIRVLQVEAEDDIVDFRQVAHELQALF